MRRLRGRYTVAWVALLGALAGLEVAALVDDGSGDTLSEHVWALLDAQPLLAVPLVGVLGWVTVHLVGGRR